MTYTVDFAIPLRGGLRWVGGTFTNAADSGSSIVSGLNKVRGIAAGGIETAIAIGIKESSTAGTITVYGETGADTDDGYWWAIGT